MEQLTKQNYRRAITRGLSQKPYNETIKLILMHVCLVACFLVVTTWITYQLCFLDPVHNHYDNYYNDKSMTAIFAFVTQYVIIA